MDSRIRSRTCCHTVTGTGLNIFTPPHASKGKSLRDNSEAALLKLRVSSMQHFSLPTDTE